MRVVALLDCTCVVKYRQALPEPLPHVAPFARIKRHVVARIESGEWGVASRVPSENQLAAEFGVSRMTARRALLELMHEGWLVRSQGLGTFVADRKPALSMLEVRNIAEEIAARGHRYSNKVLRLEEIAATEAIAMYLEVHSRSPVFHSIIVHIDNDVPVQLEDRFTNPAVAPDYLEQDFARETPNAYLSRHAPIEAVEHVVEAVLPTAEVARWLQIERAEACLQIRRRTWSQSRVASYARLAHPGSRYRMGGYVSVGDRAGHDARRGSITVRT
jgi:GntR family histidine utilization transcriptional repressor